MKRINISSGSPFERSIGFSRAVRIGNIISVSGTAPIGQDGKTYSPGDMYAQTIRCIEIIQKSVIDAGGLPENIIRTRLFLTDISQWEKAGKSSWRIFLGYQACLYFCGGQKIDK